MQHAFTPTILEILKEDFGADAEPVFSSSPLLQYLNIKTKSASRGSKSRSAFANHYAIYVLIEDYLSHEFDRKGDYGKYSGAKFSDLIRRQRELPFGAKLQNHALNHRMNEEFKKFFPTCEYTPILRNAETNRYWFNDHLLKVRVGRKTVNVASSVIRIIDAYVNAKRDAFHSFIAACQAMQAIEKAQPERVHQFVEELVQPNVDARIFEIVSFGILKQHYGSQSLVWGWSADALTEECLVLYKTGRTNANDGGIDFVMKPLGRFFQVTETTDVRKYFLDIDKVQRYPITFVVKSVADVSELLESIRQHAERVYPIRNIVDRYMECVEEVINIPALLDSFRKVVEDGKLSSVIEEIVLQSRVEFNYDDIEPEVELSE